MKTATAEPTLLERAEALPSTDLAPAPAVSMFERLAMDPNVSVEKLERLLEMQERIMRLNAKAAFDGAFSKMQPEIPVIDEHGRIEVKGSLRSTYAPLEDIHDVVKPITARHGFAIRHRTEWPVDKPGTIRIVGILSHEQGHSEETSFEAPMDRSDYRTDIQSMGSTVSYGRRYTTLDLLNISTRKADNDGQNSKAAPAPPAPDGYDDWLLKMSELANTGVAALQVEFQKSKREYREHATKRDALTWAKIKTRASAVQVPS